MSGIWALLLIGPPLLGASRAARDGFGQARGAPRLLATLVLAWAWVVLGVLVTGSVGLMARGPLLGWAAVGTALGFACGRRTRGSAEAAGHGSGVPRFEPEALVALGLALWAAIVLGMPSLMLPVKVVSDGPIYHLYFAVRWWKAGSLELVPIPFGENAATYFPAVGDLWFTYLVTAWGGDRLARVGQAPFLILAGLAVFAMARRLGARPSAAALATAWFATSTPLLLFSFEPNVDTIFVAGYLVGVYFILRYALGDDGPASLILGGLAAGGAWGTKATGTVFVPPLLGLAALIVVVRQGWTRRSLRHLAALGAGAATLSAAWFVRNAWLTGNPLYPLEVSLLGRVVFAGWYGPEVMALSQYYLPRSDWRALVDTTMAVLDPREMPLWGLALLGFWAPGRERRAGDRWIWALAGLAVLNVVLYWLVIPYRTQQRFMLHAVGLAAIPLARLFDRGAPLRIVGASVLALHLLTPQGWPWGPRDVDLPWDLSPIVPNAAGGPIPSPSLSLASIGHEAIGVFALLAAWSWLRLAHEPTRARWTSALVSAAGLAGLLGYAYSPFISGGGTLQPWSYPLFRDFHRGWVELDQRSGPSGTRIAYAGTNIPFYLFGVGLRNDVRYVNVNGHRDWLLHDYHRASIAVGRPHSPYPRADFDRMELDYDSWLANLRAAGIQILVVTRVNPAEGPHNVYDRENFPVERAWADAHPEVFEPLYGVAERDPWFRFYRLIPPTR